MILEVRALYNIPRRFVQALYVSRSNALNNSQVLQPILDYKNRLKNRDALKEDLKRRRLAELINVDEICDQWEIYKTTESRIKTLEKKGTKLKKLIMKLEVTDNLSDKQQIRLIDQQKEARALSKEYATTCDSFEDIRDRLNLNFLTLPNKLLANTPNELHIIRSHGEKSTETQCEHHLIYHNLIEYIDDKTYYLKNEASKFDQMFQLKCLDYFRHHEFEQFSNYDFARTVIIEGAAVPLETIYQIPHNLNEKFTNLVHLVGGGSWLSFLGFIANMQVAKEVFPMQMVSIGKAYQPTNSNDFGLFSTAQSTAIQLFLAGSEEAMNEKFQSTLDLIIQLFESIDIHFRVVHVAANQLESAECFATRIEMFSPHLQNYMEIGRLSHYGDFISNRLRFRCETNKKNEQMQPHIVGGTLCNVAKLLAIILETHDGSIPNAIFTNDFFVGKTINASKNK